MVERDYGHIVHWIDYAFPVPADSDRPRAAGRTWPPERSGLPPFAFNAGGGIAYLDPRQELDWLRAFLQRRAYTVYSAATLPVKDLAAWRDRAFS